jgi:hypothetical protein
MTVSLAHWEVPVKWAHYRSYPSPTVTYFVGVQANGQVLCKLFPWLIKKIILKARNGPIIIYKAIVVNVNLLPGPSSQHLLE